MVEFFAIMSLYQLMNRTIARCTVLIIIIMCIVVVMATWFGIMYSGIFYIFIFSCFRTRKLEEWARKRMVQR